jgi:hypothetical protein
MERPLYSPVKKAPIDSASVEPGQDGFDSSTLFEQVYVDPARLSLGVRRSLQHRTQVGLAELLREQPLEQGLAELVTYLSLTDDTFRVVFDDTVREHVNWLDSDDHMRTATLPGVTFARSARGRQTATPKTPTPKTAIPDGATR